MDNTTFLLLYQFCCSSVPSQFSEENHERTFISVVQTSKQAVPERQGDIARKSLSVASLQLPTSQGCPKQWSYVFRRVDFPTISDWLLIGFLHWDTAHRTSRGQNASMKIYLKFSLIVNFSAENKDYLIDYSLRAHEILFENFSYKINQ